MSNLDDTMLINDTIRKKQFDVIHMTFHKLLYLANSVSIS